MIAPRIRRLFFLLLALPMVLISSATLKAQDSTHIDGGRVALVSGALIGTVVAVHIYQADAWWQGQQQPFRFANDWEYALNIDKLGHMYGGYSESRLAQATLGWIGFDEKTSLFYGSVIGLSYQLYVEVEDGFHKEYGFSPGDGFSDIMGASIPLAQTAFPVLQNFTLKFSYWPSQNYLNELKQQQFHVFIDDYEGQTFWLGIDPHFLMGEHLAESVPPWLGIAIGEGAHGLENLGDPTRLYYLTLDYNFSKIPTSSAFLHTALSALDFFHLPAPGFAIEDGKFEAGIFYCYHVKVTL